VNVYGDGSVVVHSGVTELGQGAHVKVSQVVAHALCSVFGPGSTAVDAGVVRNADLDTSVLPNQMFTGGSTGSEGACAAAKLACEVLVKRLHPCVKAMQAKKQEAGEADFLLVDWAELCAYAKATSVDLSAHGHWSGARDQVLVYQNYGCCAVGVQCCA
jgi:indole-3-acetaldehyde oxidase